jgi:hypothetical protein
MSRRSSCAISRNRRSSGFENFAECHEGSRGNAERTKSTDAMSRTFQDRDFRVWEVYPSGGDHGYSEQPHVIFHCLTDRAVRSRWMQAGGDEAEAQRRVAQATNAELLELWSVAREID